MKRFLRLVGLLILCTSLIIMPLSCFGCIKPPPPPGFFPIFTITSSPITGVAFQVIVIHNTLSGTPEIGPLTNYTTPQTFTFVRDDIFNITALSPVSVLLGNGEREQCVWASWSDGGSQNHNYTATVGDVLTINFKVSIQAYLTVATYGVVTNAAGWAVGGTWALSPQPTPGSGWYDEGSQVTLTAPDATTDANGRQYTFGGVWWVNRERSVTGKVITVTVEPWALAIASYIDPPPSASAPRYHMRHSCAIPT
jgi:hypothetical protein